MVANYWIEYDFLQSSRRTLIFVFDSRRVKTIGRTRSATERRNIVIGGHFRLKVAKDLGIKEVPAVYVDIPNIEQEKGLGNRSDL